MWQYIFKRILLMGVVIIGVSMVTFLTLFILPGDPAEMLAISKYGAEDATPEAIEYIKEKEGLNKPVYIQYGIWLWDVMNGDLGKSRITGKSVSHNISRRLPATFEIAFAGLFLSLLIGIPLGAVAAIRKNTFLDYICTGSSLMGVAIPNFWLGLMFILIFGIYLNVLPTFGYGTFRHLLLPAFTIGLSMAGITARLTRSSIIDVLNQEHIKTARAKGLKESVIFLRHTMKNALIPIITISGIQFGHLLEGTVIVENIFAWPGIGRLLVNSIYNRDFPQIQGCVLYIAAIFCTVNLLVDISYAYLDPRVRYDNRA